ncbi:hypothetical protein VXM60_01860 [Shewanella khirikhana]|uniref:toxin-antitoxin system YwqK family antitoxin n=1 Tax=Shewanella khirikhana TaxID=1965282 RepID=UPI0030D22F6C
MYRNVFLLIFLLLAGCHSEMQRPIQAQELEQVNCREVTDKSSPLGFYLEDCVDGYQGEPFSGIALWGGGNDLNYSAAQFKDGLRDGYSFSTFEPPERLLRQSTWYKNGELHGWQLTFQYQQTRLRSRELFQDGERQELWLYNNLGQLDSFKRFEQGNVIESISYEKGRERRIEFKQNGEKLTIWKSYFPDGSLKRFSEHLDEDNLRKLKEQSYYTNGQLKSNYVFDRQQHSAVQHTFWPNGQRQSEQHYGFFPSIAADGIWLSYCETNGSLSKRTLFHRGSKQGVEQFFHCNGQLHVSKRFDQDKLIPQTLSYFDEQGRNYLLEEIGADGQVLHTRIFVEQDK